MPVPSVAGVKTRSVVVELGLGDLVVRGDGREPLEGQGPGSGSRVTILTFSRVSPVSASAKLKSAAAKVYATLAVVRTEAWEAVGGACCRPQTAANPVRSNCYQVSACYVDAQSGLRVDSFVLVSSGLPKDHPAEG